MALRTLGTNATNSLNAIMFNHDPAVLSNSDLAAFNALIKSDRKEDNLLGTALSRDGVLNVPGRLWLRVYNGDYVAIDAATGWPFVISAAAIAGGPYTHT
jgi:hypothetical protein